MGHWPSPRQAAPRAALIPGLFIALVGTLAACGKVEGIPAYQPSVIQTNNLGWTVSGSTVSSTNASVGIGTTAPAQLLHLVTDTAYNEIRQESGTGGSSINQWSAGGGVGITQSVARPGYAISQNGDFIGGIGHNAWDGSGFKMAASYRAEVDGVPAAGSMPGRLVFLTTPSGSVTSLPRLVIDNQGQVGIGVTNPAYGLEVAGTAANNSGTWAVRSDARLKREIRPIENALAMVLDLQGVTFRWKDPQRDARYGLQRGFIAQDVAKVVPEWVHAGSDGYLYLEKTGFEALAVEAIKDLHGQASEDRRELSGEIDGLRAELRQVRGAEEKSRRDNAALRRELQELRKRIGSGPN